MLSYNWPRFRNHENLSLSFTGLYENSQDVRTFSYKRAEGSAQLTQRLSKATTVFYRYAYRRVNVDQATLKITPLLIPLLAQPVRVGIVSFGVDSGPPRRPGGSAQRHLQHRGSRAGRTRLRVADATSLRFLARNATYHPIGKKLVLARSTQLRRHLRVPLYRRSAETPSRWRSVFSAAAASSHRGFPEIQAGPRDPTTGFPLGGTFAVFQSDRTCAFR